MKFNIQLIGSSKKIYWGGGEFEIVRFGKLTGSEQSALYRNVMSCV